MLPPARSGCQVDIRRGGFAFVVIAVLVVALDGPAATNASADTSVAFTSGIASGDVFDPSPHAA